MDRRVKPGDDNREAERAALYPLIPAKAGIQRLVYKNWMPACAGMSGEIADRL